MECAARPAARIDLRGHEIRKGDPGVPKRGIDGRPAGSPADRIVGLTASRAYDGTNALPDVRPPGWVDGAAGALVGVEGRRAAGAAPAGRGAAAAFSVRPACRSKFAIRISSSARFCTSPASRHRASPAAQVRSAAARSPASVSTSAKRMLPNRASQPGMFAGICRASWRALSSSLSRPLPGLYMAVWQARTIRSRTTGCSTPGNPAAGLHGQGRAPLRDEPDGAR